MRKKFLLVTLLILLTSSTAFGKINIRLDAPFFDNSTTANVSDYIGKKPLMLVFFYPDCRPCEEEAEEINRIYKRYKGKIFILGISLSRDRYDIGDFIKDMHVKYPVWRIHSKGDLRSVGGILATPTVILIDKKGKIVKKYLGKRPECEIEQDIKSLLKGGS